MVLRISCVGLLLLVLASGCAEPAPPPPLPPPTPKPDELEPKPPPPKCEAIKEGCRATKDTRARIPGTHYVFAPPKGWTYAQLEECTVAQMGEEGAVLMLTTFEPEKNRLKLTQKRGDLVGSLAELVGIKPKGRMALVRPNQHSDIAGLTMSLWERPGAERAGETGALLILESQLDDRVLYGVGYAPETDKQGTGAILKSLQTLEPGTKDDATKDEVEKPEDEKK